MEKVYTTVIKSFLVCIFCFLPGFVSAATLSLSPSNATYSVGDRVVVKVVISGDVPLNASQGIVYFPTTIFSIESVSKSNSIFNFWVKEPSISKVNGTVQFEGVGTTPFVGNNGTVLSVVLRVLKEGTGTVRFQSGQILANDGEGTDITGTLSKGLYTVVPAKVGFESEELALEVEELKPKLAAPIIELGKIEGLQAILGKSQYPKSDVVLTFISNRGSKVFISGSTDDSGSFGLIVPRVLKDGPYIVDAVIISADLGQSLPSNTIILRIGNFLWLILLVLLFIILYLFGRRHLVKDKNSQIAVKAEIKEAKEVLHKTFDNFRGGGDINELKKTLDEKEVSIKKEIDDIEKADNTSL